MREFFEWLFRVEEPVELETEVAPIEESSQGVSDVALCRQCMCDSCLIY